MQTATNPQTGETVVLVGDAWQKAERIASNDTGEKAYLVGGKWLTGDNQSANLPSVEKPKQRGLGEELLRQGGLTVRAGIEGAAALPAMAADAVGGIYNTVANAVSSPTLSGQITGERGFRFPQQGPAISNLLTRIGLPVAEGGGERVAQDVAQALAGTGTLAKAAQGIAGPVAKSLTENLGTQAASAAAASGASGTTRELGGGPGSQLIAGLAAGVGVPVAAQAVLNAPANMLAKSVRKSEATPFAKEGERLATETGIDLTSGARTGNKQVLGLENAARQYGPIADRVQDIDVKIANQAIERVQKIADGISKSKTDPAALGTQIEDTVKGAARSLDTLRDSNAGRDYGALRSLAGDKPIIKLGNLVDELKALVGEYTNVAGSDAQKVVSQAQAAINRLTGVTQQATPAGLLQGAPGTPLQPAVAKTVGTMDNTVSEALRSRRFYGKASKGAANVFEDIAPDMNRTIGARLFSAVNKDFDQAALNSDGALRKALDTANNNFRKVSQSIEFLEKSALGKMVGEDIADAAISGTKLSTTAGEAIVAKINSSHPSTRKAAIDILDRFNPQLTKDLRANLLRDALDAGMSIPPSSKGASQVPLSFSKFITALQGQKVGFDKQLASYGFSPKDIADIKTTVGAMMRAGDRTGFNFSGTQVQGQNMEIAGAIGSGVMGNLKGAATKGLAIAGKYIGLNRIADAMATQQGREALRTITSPKASPQAVIAAFETIDAQQ